MVAAYVRVFASSRPSSSRERVSVRSSSGKTSSHLEARCLDCHDTATLKGGIGLETYYHAQLPTDAGEPLFVPGKPDQSVLLHVVMESDPEKRMPPKGEPLTAAEIGTIRQWIADGANWPDDGWRPPKHWSYVAPA
jgi:hypothetical protein